MRERSKGEGQGEGKREGQGDIVGRDIGEIESS